MLSCVLHSYEITLVQKLPNISLEVGPAWELKSCVGAQAFVPITEPKN